MGTRKYYNRVGTIAIWKGIRRIDGLHPENFEYDNNFCYDKKLEDSALNGLNFKFDFSYTSDKVEGVVGMGEAGILGLSADSIRDLTTYAEQEKNLEKRNFVTVYAGYDDGGLLSNQELFTMPIIGAYPTLPPEMWLNFKGYTGSILSSTVLNFSVWGRKTENGLNTVTIKEFCEIFCETAGIELSWRMSKQEEEKLPLMNNGTAMAGKTVKEIVEFLNSLGYLKARTGITNLGVNKGCKVWLDVEDDEINDSKILESMVTTISEGDGMVGMPKYTMDDGGAKLEVTTLLRKDLNIGDLIRVKSNYIKCTHPGGIYKINAIRYHGEFRGNDWYTTYTALPFTDLTDKYLENRR